MYFCFSYVHQKYGPIFKMILIARECRGFEQYYVTFQTYFHPLWHCQPFGCQWLKLIYSLLCKINPRFPQYVHERDCDKWFSIFTEKMDINRTGGTTFYVSILPEDFQNKCQLQEAHENSQVRTKVLRELCIHTYIHRCKMNFLIFSFRGEVAQGAQFALPQVVVQVSLHKSFFSCSHFLFFWIFAVLSLASIFCSKILKEKKTKQN